MILKEFLENINKMVEKDPSILELTVITSIDAEGNGFNELYYEPSIGVFEDDEFVGSDSEDFYDEYEYSKENINAICIN
jgi:hypothetical protein